jgi:hypothetical protein
VPVTQAKPLGDYIQYFPNIKVNQPSAAFAAHQSLLNYTFAQEEPYAKQAFNPQRKQTKTQKQLDVLTVHGIGEQIRGTNGSNPLAAKNMMDPEIGAAWNCGYCRYTNSPFTTGCRFCGEGRILRDVVRAHF